MPEEIHVNPSVMMPDRMFLLGIIYGINVGRRLDLQPGEKLSEEPIFMGDESTKEDFQSMYHGSLLHFDCAHCGRVYAYNHPNEVPEHTLKCDTEGCNNIVVLYGIVEFSRMRLGNVNIFE